MTAEAVLSDCRRNCSSVGTACDRHIGEALTLARSEGRREGLEEAAKHFERKADEQAKAAKAILEKWGGRFPRDGTSDESERYNRKRFSVQLNGIAQEVRALIAGGPSDE